MSTTLECAAVRLQLGRAARVRCLFKKWPEEWRPHAVQNLTAHFDVLPTLWDIAGAKVPADLVPKLDGWSLRPLLESANPISWHDDRLLFHHVGCRPSGLAAAQKYAMAAVQSGGYLLVRSEACSSAECLKYASQCTTLRQVTGGSRRATYTKDSAAFHWGVTAPGHWSLFDLAHDLKCELDLFSSKPDVTKTLAAAYDNWWDGLYPAMIEHGGDKGTPEPLSGKAKK
jgi:arylsulfatase A-like enzyme